MYITISIAGNSCVCCLPLCVSCLRWYPGFYLMLLFILNHLSNPDTHTHSTSKTPISNDLSIHIHFLTVALQISCLQFQWLKSSYDTDFTTQGLYPFGWIALYGRYKCSKLRCGWNAIVLFPFSFLSSSFKSILIWPQTITAAPHPFSRRLQEKPEGLAGAQERRPWILSLLWMSSLPVSASSMILLCLC